MPDLRETLGAHLADGSAGWRIGSFGAIARFHQDPGEPTIVADPLTRATARGAIRIERTARRNAIRQRARIAGASQTPAAWSSTHDRGAHDADADMPGH